MASACFFGQPAGSASGGVMASLTLRVGICSFLLIAATSIPGCGSGGAVAVPDPGSPTAPTPAGPPPPLVTALAAPPQTDAGVASVGADVQTSRASEVAAQFVPELANLSLEGAAASSLVVPGGGRQADLPKADIPRHQRWEIRFPPGNSIESYTRQLDYFKIELGVIGGEDHITYLTNLSNPKPKTRPGFAIDESRLYLVWQRGDMRDADEQLAQRAGVRTAGKVLAHFLPAEVESELAKLEEAYAKQLKIGKVGRTVFGIRTAGADSFRFFVVEQKADER
jgi:hypothetical protein